VINQLVSGDFSKHYNNISIQYITRSNLLLWIEVLLLLSARIVDRTGDRINTFVFALSMMGTAVSTSTVLSIMLLYREWTNPDFTSIEHMESDKKNHVEINDVKYVLSKSKGKFFI